MIFILFGGQRILCILQLKCFPRSQLFLFKCVLGSFYFLRYVWGDESQPHTHPFSTAHAQLHWGSALVVHQMFNVISLLKVVTKPQRVKWWQSVKQLSLFFFIFHYSPPYVTVFSVWNPHCLFLLISFITVFNLNDIQLLRIFFRAKLHLSPVKRKTTRTCPLLWEIQRCRIFAIDRRKCDGCPDLHFNPIRLLLKIMIEWLFTH